MGHLGPSMWIHGKSKARHSFSQGGTFTGEDWLQLKQEQ